MEQTDAPDIFPIVEEGFRVGMAQRHDEVVELLCFLLTLSPRHVVEIGTDRGGLFYCFHRVCNGMAISIDLPGGAFATGAADYGRVEQTIGIYPNAYAIRGNSHAAEVRERLAGVLRGETVDFLFIDGDHSLPGVTADYYDYRAFVRPGGWVGFHEIKDTHQQRQARIAVAKLWRTLRGRTMEFCDDGPWGGIGLIQVPESPGPKRSPFRL